MELIDVICEYTGLDIEDISQCDEREINNYVHNFIEMGIFYEVVDMGCMYEV